LRVEWNFELKIVDAKTGISEYGILEPEILKLNILLWHYSVV
jgi:hypothetical protein